MNPFRPYVSTLEVKALAHLFFSTWTPFPLSPTRREQKTALKTSKNTLIRPRGGRVSNYTPLPVRYFTCKKRLLVDMFFPSACKTHYRGCAPLPPSLAPQTGLIRPFLGGLGGVCWHIRNESRFLGRKKVKNDPFSAINTQFSAKKPKKGQKGE